MIFIVGINDKKLLVYSQASVTNIPDFPIRIFPPILFKIPPTDIVGSASAARSISVTIDVVVVFPCVPAMFKATS